MPHFLTAEIQPRPLTPAGYRALGVRLRQWAGAESGSDGCCRGIEPSALESLLEGEAPLPLAVRFLNGLEKHALEHGLEPLRGDARKQAVRTWCGADNPRLPPEVAGQLEKAATSAVVLIYCNPDRSPAVIAASLQASIGELIESIRINGQEILASA